MLSFLILNFMNIFLFLFFLIIISGMIFRRSLGGRVVKVVGAILVLSPLILMPMYLGLFDGTILSEGRGVSLYSIVSFVSLGVAFLASINRRLQKMHLVEISTVGILMFSLIVLIGFVFKSSFVLSWIYFANTPVYLPILLILFSSLVFIFFLPKYKLVLSTKHTLAIVSLFFVLVSGFVFLTLYIENILEDPDFNKNNFVQLLPLIILILGIIASFLFTLSLYSFAFIRLKAMSYANEMTKGLRTAKAKDEAMLESIGEGLVATGKDGNIVLVNHAFEDLLGWKEEEVQGKLFVSFIPLFDEKGKELPKESRPIYKILKQGKVKRESITKTNAYYKSKSDRLFPVAITISPIVVEDEVIGVVEVFRDITKEKEIDKEKTEFVSLASHQLRTPLSTINWYAEMLLDGDAGKLNKEQIKYLNEIYSGNQRMVKLVNSLLNVSRLELGTFTIEPEEVNFVKLAKIIIKEQKPQIKSKSINLSVELEKDLPKIKADPKLISMVFQNLLSNSVKYTDKGGEISFKVGSKGGDVHIRITDSGWGIPQKEQSKIFSKLYRASNVKEGDTEGTGLGLYIVKSIIEESGGRITFTSKEGKGTSFFVTLPMKGMKEKKGTRHLS